MKTYERIFEGASAYHLGYATAIGEGALVLEPTLHAAKEYIEALRPCLDTPCGGRLSKAMRAQLEKLDAIRNGRIHPQGAEHILINETGKSGAEMLFLTQVLSVEKDADGLVHVDALCLDKVQHFLCRHFHPAPKAQHSFFNALARVNDATLLPADVLVHPTVYETLSILSIPQNDLGKARRYLSSLKGITIAHFPSILCECNDHDLSLFEELDAGEADARRLAECCTRQAPAVVRHESCDVLVVGAGTAGSVAALGAARTGSKVIAVDRLSFAGGLSTTTVFGYYYSAKGGLYEEIDAHARALSQTGIAAATSSDSRLNPVAHIIAYDQIFDREGIEYIGEAFLVKVFIEGRLVTGARLLAPEGYIDINCKFIIDGTSENHVCTLAGCGFHMGRDFDGKTQPFSYVTLLCDEKNILTNMYSSDFGYTDAADAKAVSDNILRSTYKLELPAGKVHLGVSCSLGAREGRCINGMSRISWKDYFNGTPIDRPVTFGLSNMDDHGKDMAFESRMHADWMVGMSMWGTNVRLQVPMGALIPEELDNCAVAGRNLDMDHDCASHLRMMRDLRRIGEASGRIAGLAVKHDCPANDVPYDELKSLLVASGCLSDVKIPDAWDTRPCNVAVKYPQNDEEALALMQTSSPGLALLYLLRENKQELVREGLESQNKWFAFNSACALALSGNASGKDILLDALKRRDMTLLETSRKFNMTRGLVALYLLGRLAVPECENEGRKIWEEDEQLVKYAVPSDEFFYRPEDTRFAYLSHATRALLEIARAYPAHQEDILSFLREKTRRQDFHTWYSLKTSRNVVKDGADEIRTFIEKGAGK